MSTKVLLFNNHLTCAQYESKNSTRMIYVLMKILLDEVKEWSSNDISLLTSRVHIYRLSHSAFRRTLRSQQITKQQKKTPTNVRALCIGIPPLL